jgi:dienelactone hydrolase
MLGWRIISKLLGYADELTAPKGPQTAKGHLPMLERGPKENFLANVDRDQCMKMKWRHRPRNRARALPIMGFAILLSTLVGAASAEEFSQTTLTLETGARAKVVNASDSAWVVMVHGWSGVLDEVGDLYLRQADRLASEGISSIRVQIQGEGDALAQGEPLNSTFSSRVADARSALQWVQDRYPKAQVGLLGFSYGGPTVMRLAVTTEPEVQSMVLWSSALNPIDIVKDESQAGAVRDALETGVGIIKSWMPIAVTRRHVLGMLGESILPEFSAYQGALLTIRGSNDYLPQADSVILGASSAALKEAIVIEGATHIFNVVEPDQSRGDQRFAERVMDSTTQWFKETLSPAG